MAGEIELRIKLRVTDWARFEEVFEARVNTPMSGFDASDIAAMVLPDKVFEVLIGSNPDVGPDHLGLEIIDWKGTALSPLPIDPPIDLIDPARVFKK
jgi:hypothetical protein